MPTTTNEKWPEVTKAAPCPICKKTHWCDVSPDGKIVKCMRVREGSYKTTRDSGYLHKIDGAYTLPHVQPKKAKKVHTSEESMIRTAEYIARERNEGQGTWKFWKFWTYPRGVLRVYRVNRTDVDVTDPKNAGVKVKEYIPFCPVRGGWSVGDPEGLLPLYRSDQLNGQQRVVLVEGEKCADALWSLGLPAVTSAHGAKSTNKADWSPLAGREVVVFPDHDGPGNDYATKAAFHLGRLNPPARVKIGTLPGLTREGDDVYDWIQAGGTKDVLQEIIDDARDVTTAADPQPEEGGGRLQFSPDDIGAKLRLVHYFGDRLRYVPQWGWLVWDGKRWARDEELQVQRFAEETALRIVDDAKDCPNEATRKAVLDLARKYQSYRNRQFLIADAQAHPKIIAKASAFDTDPWLINVLNGTLDLRTGNLRPHNPSDNITKLAPVEYRPGATCDLFQDFLFRIFANNDNLIGYIQKAIGYGLTGSTAEQRFFIAYGSGANGKSTLLTTISDILGEDYAIDVEASTFLEQDRQGIRNDVARLRGIRLAFSKETKEGQRLNEGFVKAATGGEKLVARFLYREEFQFSPAFKVWLCTNHKPTIKGTDHGIWRRIDLIPFSVTISDGERDVHFKDKLMAEREGIFAWAVRGAMLYQSEGLPQPSEVKAATADYRSQMDTLGQFVTECLIDDAGGKALSAEVYRAYQRWCNENGEIPMKQTGFSLRLAERGYTKKHTAGGALWSGFSLKTPEYDGSQGE